MKSMLHNAKLINNIICSKNKCHTRQKGPTIQLSVPFYRFWSSGLKSVATVFFVEHVHVVEHFHDFLNMESRLVEEFFLF